MMLHTTRPLLVGLLALAAACSAHAGRPFVTEDAGVLDAAACEWEGLAARATQRGAPHQSAWALQVGCGIGHRSQLALAIGGARSGDERTRELALGAKTGLVDGGEQGLSLTVAYGAAWQRAAGRQRFDNAFVNLVASSALGSGVTGHANLGLLHTRSPRDTVGTWALAAEKAVAEGVDLGAELYGEGSDKPWFGVGARWRLAERVSVNASWAAQSGSAHARLVTLGFKFEF